MGRCIRIRLRLFCPWGIYVCFAYQPHRVIKHQRHRASRPCPDAVRWGTGTKCCSGSVRLRGRRHGGGSRIALTDQGDNFSYTHAECDTHTHSDADCQQDLRDGRCHPDPRGRNLEPRTYDSRVDSRSDTLRQGFCLAFTNDHQRNTVGHAHVPDCSLCLHRK